MGSHCPNNWGSNLNSSVGILLNINIMNIIDSEAANKAKFVRQFANLKGVRDTGVHDYAEAVRARTFPDPETESYTADKAEWERFMGNEKDEGDDIQ